MVQGRLIVSAMGGVIQAVKRDTAAYPKRYADLLVVEDSSGNRAGAQARDTPGSTVDFGIGTAYPFPDILWIESRSLIVRKAHVERRDSPRYEIEVPLTFSGNAIAGSGLVTSLSNEGCHVVSEESLPARACLSLHVEFPAPYEPMTVEVAEVRWTNATGFGLVFVHVHDEEHTRLQRFIDWLKRTHNN